MVVTTRRNESDNATYLVGRDRGEQFRNFFTFDLSGISGEITRATLRLHRSRFVDVLPAVYRLYDVSTPAPVLNRTEGPDRAIYDDLGSGTPYGYFRYSGDANRFTRFLTLNAAGLAAANAARGGYFSVGGTTLGGSGALFGGEAGPQRLQLTVSAD